MGTAGEGVKEVGGVNVGNGVGVMVIVGAGVVMMVVEAVAVGAAAAALAKSCFIFSCNFICKAAASLAFFRASAILAGSTMTFDGVAGVAAAAVVASLSSHLRFLRCFAS